MTQFKTAGERVRMQISVAVAVSFLLQEHFRLCCMSSFVFVAGAVSAPAMISRPAFKYAFAVAIVPGMDAQRRSGPWNWRPTWQRIGRAKDRLALPETCKANALGAIFSGWDRNVSISQRQHWGSDPAMLGYPVRQESKWATKKCNSEIRSLMRASEPVRREHSS